MAIKLSQFFFKNRIFSSEQFIRAMGHSARTCQAMLTQHMKGGNIVRIKQGLYAVIPAGADPEGYPIDPYAIMSFLAKDAIIAYHTALQFHGLAYSVHFQLVFLSAEKVRNFQFRQDRFKVTQYPKSLPPSKHFIFTEKIDHHGFSVCVTNQERTLVDVLDRINLSGGLEEVWRSLDNIQQIKVEEVVEYALLLQNTTTIAKVGFYLRLRQKEWQIPESYFNQLKLFLPKSNHYLDRTRKRGGKYIKEWRLVIPQELVDERWEEVLDMDDI